METIELLDSILHKLDTLEDQIEKQQQDFKHFKNIIYSLFFQKEMYDFQCEESMMKSLSILLKISSMGPVVRTNKKIAEECNAMAKITMQDSLSCTGVIEEMMPRVKELFDKADCDPDFNRAWIHAKASRESKDDQSVKESS